MVSYSGGERHTFLHHRHHYSFFWIVSRQLCEEGVVLEVPEMSLTGWLIGTDWIRLKNVEEVDEKETRS